MDDRHKVPPAASFVSCRAVSCRIRPPVAFGNSGPGDLLGQVQGRDDSVAGKACFLSCAYVLCEYVRGLQSMGRGCGRYASSIALGGGGLRRVHGRGSTRRAKRNAGKS